MPIATLLNRNDPSFDFDHDQFHRRMFTAIPAGAGASASPYLLDPVIGAAVPAGYWNFNHATAHSDFANAFPTITWPSNVKLIDLNLSVGSQAWWMLSNRTLHDIANTMLNLNA
jgi:hypothetical protein